MACSPPLPPNPPPPARRLLLAAAGLPLLCAQLGLVGVAAGLAAAGASVALVEVPALALLPEIVEARGLTRAYASCYAVTDMTNSLAFSAGPLLGAAAYDALGFGATFALAAAACVLAACTTPWLRTAGT